MTQELLNYIFNFSETGIRTLLSKSDTDSIYALMSDEKFQQNNLDLANKVVLVLFENDKESLQFVSILLTKLSEYDVFVNFYPEIAKIVIGVNDSPRFYCNISFENVPVDKMITILS